jgi:hypothetical protein
VLHGLTEQEAEVAISEVVVIDTEVTLNKQPDGTTEGGSVESERLSGPRPDVMSRHAVDVLHLVKEEGGECRLIVTIESRAHVLSEGKGGEGKERSGGGGKEGGGVLTELRRVSEEPMGVR